jgi:hypothetical protein
MKNLLAAAMAAALAIAGAATAYADDGQVGNGNVRQNGVDQGPSSTNGNHSVLVQTVNGVTTVIVDGVQLYGDEAQPYIDAARNRARR